MPCKQCKSDKLLVNEKEGNRVCENCGLVQSENAIVSELAFAENQYGGANLVGKMVGFGQTGAAVRTNTGTHFQSSSDDTTAAKARERAEGFARNLKIAEHHVDAAVRFFKLGLAHNFSRGRKAEVTMAVCLYASCRLEKTSHMLIDFTDIAESSVFVLGSAFVKLIKLLNLHHKMDLVDPSLYIQRFVGQLKFGDKLANVIETSLRLVTRMNKDWMVTGRRPAGICGACILIASRIHHFNRTIEQVSRVVRVSTETIRKRLEEFAATESGKMTVGDFNRIMIENGEDPPAFKKLQRLEIEEAASDQDSLSKGHTVSIESRSDFAEEETEIIALDAEQIDEELSKLASISAPAKTVYPKWEDKMEDDDLSALDEDYELKTIFLTHEEYKIKESIWDKENYDYTKAKEAKEAREEADKINGTAKPVIRRGKRTLPVIKNPTSAADSTKQYFKQTAISRKINYDAIDQLFDIDILGDHLKRDRGEGEEGKKEAKAKLDA